MIKLNYELAVSVAGRVRMVVVEGDFTPGRPPPPCSNPDSPAFSDDGDPPEANITGVKDKDTGEVFVLDTLTDDEMEDLLEAFIDRAQDDPKVWEAEASDDWPAPPEEGGDPDVGDE